jgi:hypothetical protein
MKSLRLWLLLAVLPVVAGCLGIYSEQPLGEEVAVLKPEEWNGTWVGETGQLSQVIVIDSENGMLGGGNVVFETQGERAGQFLCDPPGTPDKPLQLRRWGDWYFFTESDSFPYWYLLVSRRRKDAWMLYSFDEKHVADLVTEGALPGRVENGEVTLGAMTSEHYKILLDEKRPSVYWQQETILLRLPATLDPCKKAGQAE